MHNESKWSGFIKVVKRDRYLYLLLVPAAIYYIVFCYIPIYGNIIAFQDYHPSKGITGSEWVGLKYFIQFFESQYFGRLIKNTLLMSVYSILWGFPIPILFALALNEIRDGLYKRVTQTVSYLPHFISLVIMVGIMITLLDSTSSFSSLVERITGSPLRVLGEPVWFRTLYVGSGIWQEFGWSSIIYISAMTSISPIHYEAAKMDGAGKLRRMLHVTLPGIMPIVVVLLILNVGSLMSVGYAKIILMYSPGDYEVSDVISTYVYRAGLLGQQYSFGAAVDLFNSVCNFILLVAVNYFSRKASDITIW